MKNSFSVSFLNGLLVAMLVFTILPFFALVYQAAMIGSGYIINNILQIIVGLILSGGYFMIILMLRRIIKSIRENPFNPDNIRYFKRIGTCILILGIIEAIINYPIPNNSGLEILATSYGSLKPIFFLYLVLSTLCYILSDVFRMAMEIKDENDLTV